MPTALAQFITRTALCRELTPGATVAPEWVELIPAGPAIEGRDGRRFRLESPEAVVAAYNAAATKGPIDWEHATQLQAPEGKPAPAAAWVEQLEVRNGAIWGRVTWTPTGAASVQSREYRYLSPAFRHDPAGNVTQFVSAGLTNSPNLVMTALHSEGAETTRMNPKIKLALKLPENATDEQVLEAITALNSQLQTAVNSASAPSLDKFVPRGDYELAVNRAKTAEGALETQKRAALEREVDAEIELATKAGKITPATVAYHRGTCLREGGLALFREFVKAAPAIAQDSKLDEKKPGEAGAGTVVALNAAEQAVVARLGITPEAFVATRATGRS